MKKASKLYENDRSAFVHPFVHDKLRAPPLKVNFRMLRPPSPPGFGAPHRTSPPRAILFSPAAAASGSGQAPRYPRLALLAWFTVPYNLGQERERWEGGDEGGGVRTPRNSTVRGHVL